MGHVSNSECKTNDCEYFRIKDGTGYCLDCDTPLINIEWCGIAAGEFKDEQARSIENKQT
jgi:hypothetical protein